MPVQGAVFLPALPVQGRVSGHFRRRRRLLWRKGGPLGHGSAFPQPEPPENPGNLFKSFPLRFFTYLVYYMFVNVDYCFFRRVKKEGGTSCEISEMAHRYSGGAGHGPPERSGLSQPAGHRSGRPRHHHRRGRRRGAGAGKQPAHLPHAVAGYG